MIKLQCFDKHQRKLHSLQVQIRLPQFVQFLFNLYFLCFQNYQLSILLRRVPRIRRANPRCLSGSDHSNGSRGHKGLVVCTLVFIYPSTVRWLLLYQMLRSHPRRPQFHVCLRCCCLYNLKSLHSLNCVGLSFHSVLWFCSLVLALPTNPNALVRVPTKADFDFVELEDHQSEEDDSFMGILFFISLFCFSLLIIF
jgi:hypothetical protein